MNGHFFQKSRTDGQQAHEKVLNITNPQGNASQTTMRYHLTFVIIGIMKETINNKC